MNNEAMAEGLRHASDTRVIEVGREILPRSGEILARSLAQDGRPVLLVADDRTWDAAGRGVAASLEEAGVALAEPLIFPGTPTLYAAYEHCEVIRERLCATGPWPWPWGPALSTTW
nr:hypothetical protein [Raineyella fluvialis]